MPHIPQDNEMAKRLNVLWHDFICDCAALDAKIYQLKNLDIIAFFQPDIVSDIEQLQRILHTHAFRGIPRIGAYKDLLESYDREARGK